jgi:hypothetical protein
MKIEAIRRGWVVAALMLHILAPFAVRAQTLPPAADSADVVPGALYAAGAFHRRLFGDHYRDVWAAPIRVPVLDLGAYAGGLTPLSAHAGSQTRSLRFRGADGRTYQFRSVFKTPTARLRLDLQPTLVADIIQDGASASHPGSTLVAARLLAAANVLHADPFMSVMPDDARLGAFRQEFAGMLGVIEERPNEAGEEGDGGFGEALKVIGPSRLFERIDASPEDRVDARAFLTSRLMDILFGDRDRHRDNFRWALMDDSGPARRWVPISRDHDEAFVKLDGLLLHVASVYYPQLTSFAPDFGDPANLNWHAREVDRRFLVGLDRAVWDSTATWIQSRLTDEVISSAVHTLPEGMYRESGAYLTYALLTRREHLREEAGRYYDLLAREVEIHATNADEVLEVDRVDDRYVDVSIRADEPGSVPYLSRRFDDSETHDLRINMWGGRDRVVVRGDGDAGIALRIVGGKGRDRLTDESRAGGVRFYDSGDKTDVTLRRGSSLDARSYEEWIGSDLDRYPPREWGGWTRPLPWADAGPEMGLLLGMSVVRTKYGFRRSPYASQIMIQAGWTTGEGWGRVHGHARFYGENTITHFDLDAGISDIAFLRYHGLGNDTQEDTRARDFSVELNELHLAPSIGVPLGPGVEVTLGADVTSDRPSGDDSPFFRSVSDTLYGAGDFTRVGLSAGLAWRSERESPVRRTSLAAEVKSRVVPAVWDVRSTYADLTAEVGARVGAPARAMRPSLSLKAGGRSIFGSAPFQDAAYLGGRRNLRGWSRERFAGDAAVYGSAELRLQLVSTQVVLPANVGVLGLYDIGRVFVNGDSPGGWHKGVGLGLWVSFLDPDNTLSVTWARSRERTAFYVGMGFAF